MKEYTSSNPVFNEKIRVVDTSDPDNADLISIADKQNFENTLVLKNQADMLQETKAEKTDLTTPFNFKGSCLSTDLPGSENAVNDTYYCTDLKHRMTWNGTEWYQSSLDESDYEDELSGLKSDLMYLFDRFQFVNPETLISDKYWIDVEKLATDTAYGAFSSIKNLKSGKYYFCGINPAFSWIVNRSTGQATKFSNLYDHTDENFYLKYSITIDYDFDLYLTRMNTYSVVTKFSKNDFSDLYSYEMVDNEFDIKVYPTIITNQNYNVHLADVNNAKDNTLYRMAINNVIPNLPDHLTPDSYFLLTLTNQYLNKKQKKQIIFTVNGTLDIKWFRYFQDSVWFDWADGITITSLNNRVNTLEEKIVTKQRTIVYVGATETYKNIDEALDSITDNSSTKPYTVFVKNGTYDVPNSKLYFGIKNYVDIIGEDKTNTIIRNIHSTNAYDASRATFDPAGYNDSIINANLSNMTIISQGCKCPIHIDGSNIANGGKITIDNCILMDLNTPNNYYTSQRLTRIGGVNCGLRNGQSVTVKNTISNGTLYAHNCLDSTSPCKFVIDNCTCRGTLIGSAFENSVKDEYVIRNSTLDYVAIQTLEATSNMYNVTMSNNKINYIFAPDNDNITDPYYTFDLFFGGKCGIPDTSCMQLMFNCSDNTISRGDIVYSKSDGNARGWLSETYIKGTGVNFIGIAMENIPAWSVGWVQNKGKISIPKIDNANYGDLIDFVNGEFIAHQSGNTPIGKYAEISPLYDNQYMIQLLN